MARIFLTTNYKHSEVGSQLLTATLYFEKINSIIQYVFMENLMNCNIQDCNNLFKKKLVKDMSMLNMAETRTFIKTIFNDKIRVDRREDINESLQSYIKADIANYMELCNTDKKDKSNKIQIITDTSDYEWVKFIDFVYGSEINNNICEHILLESIFKTLYPSIPRVDRIGYHLYNIPFTGYYTGIKEYEEKKGIEGYNCYSNYTTDNIVKTVIMKSCHDRLLELVKSV